MNKQQILEQDIFVKIQEIDECDRTLMRLRSELKDLMQEYIAQDIKELRGNTVLFTFNGKNKDLLRKLRQELEKANSKI